MTFDNWYDLEDHYRNLAQREHLQEFTGRIPTQRKKKKDTEARQKVKVKKNYPYLHLLME